MVYRKITPPEEPGAKTMTDELLNNELADSRCSNLAASTAVTKEMIYD
jgi:hypothetical protein